MRHLVALLPLITLLAACSSTPKPSPTATPQGTPVKGGFLLSPAHSGAPLGGDFANNPNTARFIDKMVQEHGFDRQQLQEIRSAAAARRAGAGTAPGFGSAADGQAGADAVDPGANRAEWLLAALPQQVHHAG